MNYCIECGNDIIKKSYESKTRYAGKKFCSQKCSRVYMKRNKMGWYNPEIQTLNKKRKVPWDDTTDPTETPEY